jgi:hypothetical protein
VNRTRRALHAVAENLLAGPQFRASGTIRLRATERGFGTVVEPDVRVDGVELVVARQRYPIAGATLQGLADAAGLSGGPARVYASESDVAAGEPLEVHPADAAALAEVFALGDAALRRFAPVLEPVLWPEHFDVGVRIDDSDYGVSPGDSFMDEAYAYVSAQPVADDAEFWNAPFGAARPLAQVGDVEDLVAFFSEARTRRPRRG